MEQIVYNIEKDFLPRTMPTVVPVAYQALYMLNLKMEEIKKYCSLPVEECDAEKFQKKKISNDIL